MKPLVHLVASSLISSFVYILYRSIGVSLIAFVAGIFIDLDYILDYLLNYGFRHAWRNWRDFYSVCVEMRFEKVYLFLHSFELVILLWILVTCLPYFYCGRTVNLYRALAIGVTQHLLLDFFSNPVHPLAYFLWFRIANKFRKERFLQLY